MNKELINLLGDRGSKSFHLGRAERAGPASEKNIPASSILRRS